MAIYDTMQFVSPDVATLCVGQAASTAALLLAAGAPGKRTLLTHARVLLHQPHSEGTRGSMSDLALEAAELARVRAEADAVLARHTGRTAEGIRTDTDRALVLAGRAAVDYGLVDAVADGSRRQELDPTVALRPGA
jgi:ATP-dependent Clp protease protease subunit